MIILSLVKIGLVGKPNVGKSTLFSAITESDVEVANYPFTTIKPNVGVALFKTRCPEVEIGVKCSPREGRCVNGTRYVPVEVIDVPGLIPGASEGKGMGNEFLDNIRDSDAIIHVFDSSGTTSLEGTPSGEEITDPLEEIAFVRAELIKWMSSKLSKDWEKFARKVESRKDKPERLIVKKVASFGLGERDVAEILLKEEFPSKLSHWNEEFFTRFAESVFRYVKPLIHIGNKADIAKKETLDRIREKYPETFFISAEYELAIRKAKAAGFINSIGADFELSPKCSEKQKEALNMMRGFFGGSGIDRIEDVVEQLVRKTLGYIVVFPVYDESHWTDKDGNVLPDAFLVRKGENALNLAFRVHTEIGEGFIRAIDCRKKMVVSKDHELNDGDVIRIVSKTK